MKFSFSSALTSFAKKLFAFLLALSFLLVVGNLLINYLVDVRDFAWVPEKNNRILILWRIAIYSLVILLLTPAVLTWFEQAIPIPQAINYQRLLEYRKATIISIIIYELIIVQDIFKIVVQWGYYYVS